jgi:signal transduction histidine kinase
LAALTAFLAVGLVIRLPDNPAAALTGTLVAIAAGVPMFLARPQFLLVYAAVATAGVALSNTSPRTISWFAVCVLGAWCVLAGGIRVAATYWAASALMFGGEWLLVDRDPGWGDWTAGLSSTILASIVIRHQLLLVQRLRSAQADLAERSRADERNRIAHELHDVVAHSLTVSLLHVSSARLAVEHDDRADAVRALAEAERLGRQALTEVRTTMGLPHPGAAPGIAPPVPGIGDLQRLVEEVRDAGVDACLFVEGDVGALPATTGSAVYRIVREALTNAARHAPGASVTVRAASLPGCIEVFVDSAGPPGHGSGMGLLSMSARAEAVGGTCTAGPGGTGWLVHARLPVDARLGVDVR